MYQKYRVSITPGRDETELNFAWYSEKTEEDATPVVHFGKSADDTQTFTGTSGEVNPELTGGAAYEYNFQLGCPPLQARRALSGG